jgi:hypothetical protein
VTREGTSAETAQLLAELRALVQRQAEQIAALQQENAALRARLDGQGPPGSAMASTADSIAALREKRQRLQENRTRRRAKRSAHPALRRRGKRTPRVHALVMDHTHTLALDPTALPADVQFKGYAIRRFQDVELVRHNTAFRLAKYYSPSLGRTFQASPPAGYMGEFGPGLRAFCLTLYWDTTTSEAPLHRLLTDAGIRISAGQIARLVAQPPEAMHAEKRAMHHAGVQAAPYAQIDTTYTSCDGDAGHCHAVVNDVMTSFVTTPTKERLAAIGALGGGAPEHLVTAAVLDAVALPAVHRAVLETFPQDVVLSAPAFEALVAQNLRWVGQETLRRLREGTALAALKVRLPRLPPVLMTDDAKSFAKIFDDQGLCWPHALRPLEELCATAPAWQAEIDDACSRAWALYARLKAWQHAPAPSQIATLEAAFDATFQRTVGCPWLQDALDTIASKKHALLAVCRHPQMPLHNNGTEIEQRRRVRKRDVSFGPRSADGLRAWDTMQSLVATTRKLGLSFLAFVTDRLRGLGTIPPLDQLIRTAAFERGLLPAPAPSV